MISRRALQPGAVSSVEEIPQVVLCSEGNGNEVKWSEKLESVAFLSSGVIYQFIVEEIIR